MHRRDSAFRVHLFGVPSFEFDGVGVSFSTRPLSAVLLAMVLLAEPDRRLSRRALAAELWPADDESTATGKLRRHLSFLITALPAAADCVGRDRNAIWCRGSAAPWCDVAEFERGALELYRADFMEGSAHEWVLAQRERLRTAAVDGLLRRAETHHENDDSENALADIRVALQIDPANETAAQLELTLHGERGDIAALDAAYAALERRLREIDVRPGSDTVALVDRFHALSREAASRLPRPPTSYVERSRIADVASLAAANRLVTIVGPGGAGKTRLALEVAHKIAGTFPDGAYFADLSTVSEGDALSDALSRALGVPNDLAAKGFTGVTTLLRNRRSLLVLDNCEQITESCSWFLSRILESASHLHVIATTRESFGLSAECCYALQPLSTSNALELFVDRARHAGWDIGATAMGTGRIAAICRRLDCLPLSLELAASMLGTLSLTDVERQLERGLGEVRSRDVATPARHRSLRNVIEWSVSLLDERERAAFARLATFTGSFSAAAAAAICGVDRATIGELVAKSVLVREDAIDGRFVFLNTVGEYAHGLFDADRDATALRDAHAAWYGHVAMRSTEVSFWNAEAEWLREIDGDFANASAALQWSLFAGGAPENGIRLAIGLTLYFLRRGFLADGGSWIRAALGLAAPESFDSARLQLCLTDIEIAQGRYDPALELACRARSTCARLGSDRDMARALNSESAVLTRLHRFDEARALLEQALPFSERSGDLRTEAMILSNLGFILSLSDQRAARDTYGLSLRTFHRIGDQGCIAYVHLCIATLEYTAGNYAFAKRNLERALEIHRALDDVMWMSGIVADLGDATLMQGDLQRAREHYAEALELCMAHGLALMYAQVFSGCAALALEHGRERDAACLLGAAGTKAQTEHQGANQLVFERARARVEHLLGVDEAANEILFGRNLTLKDATSLARSVLTSFADVSR